MKINKITLAVIIVTSIIVTGLFSCNIISSGSYPDAERYEIKTTDTLLINAINIFKEKNPDFCVPTSTMLEDGQSNDRDDHWYHVYFYFKEDNMIVYSWVRQSDKESTTFAFVSINDGLILGHWKDINKDFSSQESKLQKDKFEKKILEPIKKILTDK